MQQNTHDHRPDYGDENGGRRDKPRMFFILHPGPWRNEQDLIEPFDKLDKTYRRQRTRRTDDNRGQRQDRNPDKRCSRIVVRSDR